MNSHKSLIALSALLALSCAARPPVAPVEGEHTLAFTVEGIETVEGVLRVALYNSENDWLNEERMIRARLIPVAQERETVEIWGLPAGDYAVAVYHDRNNNSRLDTRLGMIPAEPWGVSNNAKGLFGMSTPSFQDSVYTVPLDEERLIKLNPPPLPE